MPKERFNHQREREKTNMVLEKEWLLLMVEKFLLRRRAKGRKKISCIFRTKSQKIMINNC